MNYRQTASLHKQVSRYPVGGPPCSVRSTERPPHRTPRDLRACRKRIAASPFIGACGEHRPSVTSPQDVVRHIVRDRVVLPDRANGVTGGVSGVWRRGRSRGPAAANREPARPRFRKPLVGLCMVGDRRGRREYLEHRAPVGHPPIIGSARLSRPAIPSQFRAAYGLIGGSLVSSGTEHGRRRRGRAGPRQGNVSLILITSFDLSLPPSPRLGTFSGRAGGNERTNSVPKQQETRGRFCLLAPSFLDATHLGAYVEIKILPVRVGCTGSRPRLPAR